MSASTIQLCGPFEATDSEGLFWKVKGMALEASGTLPDVLVSLSEPAELKLLVDPVFMRCLNDQLRAAGYAGQALESAESGMQCSTMFVLEPKPEFRDFAVSKGWVDEHKLAAVRWCSEWEAAREQTVKRQEFSVVVELRALDSGVLPIGDNNYVKTLDSFEAALQNNGHRIEGWSWKDHYDIECNLFEICQFETEYPAEERDGPYTRMALTAPLLAESSQEFDTGMLRKVFEGVAAVLDEHARTLGMKAELTEVKLYRVLEQSQTGVLFRKGISR